MCEPFVLRITGLSVADHQRLTIARYDAAGAGAGPRPRPAGGAGLPPEHYAAHVAAYGERLRPGCGSASGRCAKRNGRASEMAAVLRGQVQAARPAAPRVWGERRRSERRGARPAAQRGQHGVELPGAQAGRDANDWRGRRRSSPASRGGRPTGGARWTSCGGHQDHWGRRRLPGALHHAHLGGNAAIALFGVLPLGLSAPAGVLFAGLSFSVRDALQDAAGRRWTVAGVLVGALLGGALRPLALASGRRSCSELADLAVTIAAPGARGAGRWPVQRRRAPRSTRPCSCGWRSARWPTCRGRWRQGGDGPALAHSGARGCCGGAGWQRGALDVTPAYSVRARVDALPTSVNALYRNAGRGARCSRTRPCCSATSWRWPCRATGAIRVSRWVVDLADVPRRAHAGRRQLRQNATGSLAAALGFNDRQITAWHLRGARRGGGEGKLLEVRGVNALFPIASLVPCTLAQANDLLTRWAHKMGPINRPNGLVHCHALLHEDEPVALTVTSAIVAANVAAAPGPDARTCIELSRLCAARSGLNRVMLRLWRELIFPTLATRSPSAIRMPTYNGNTYRFDGWKRVNRDRHASGRAGRDKWIWLWEDGPPPAPPPCAATTSPAASPRAGHGGRRGRVAAGGVRWRAGVVLEARRAGAVAGEAGREEGVRPYYDDGPRASQSTTATRARCCRASRPTCW